jgi:sulfur carrier protein
MTMHIELNGTPHAVADDATLQSLVVSLALADKALAVAVNRDVVPRQLWPQRVLQAADRVDIVRAIGGG